MLELALLSLFVAALRDASPPPRRKRVLRVYHGSREADLTEIEPNDPGYSGSLGWGIYVTEDVETARFYGPHIYALDLSLDEDEVLDIDVQSDDVVHVDELTGRSILVGEHVEAFSFQAGGERYVCADSDVVDQVALIRFTEAVRRDPTLAAGLDLRKLERDYRLPTFEDEYDLEEVVQRIWPDEDPTTPEEVARIEMKGQTLFDRLAALSARVEAEARLLGTPCDLDELGAIARHHGYRAVRMDGMRGGHPDNEILVLHPEDLVMVGPLKPGADEYGRVGAERDRVTLDEDSSCSS